MRRFLMQWVLAPGWIRICCYLCSRMLRQKSSIFDLYRKSDVLYILATGPSLNKDLCIQEQALKSAEILAVNSFVSTPAFVKVRPSLYLLADPGFFTSFSHVGRVVREVCHDLCDKVSWPLTLIVPDGSECSDFVRLVSSNRNISILRFWRGVPVPEDIVDFKGWKANRYAPPTQNVINTALYLGIVWDYEKIVLLGADTSFHTMLRLDQQTNQPYIENEHFYGKEKQYLFKDAAHTVPQKLSEQFTCIATAFRWYDKLREFADWAGVKIINASSFSWIDAFERPRT